MGILLTVISKVPFAALYFVSRVFYLLNRYLIRYRYDVVRSNLRNSFPGRSDAEIDALTEETFRNLSDLLVETIKGIGISREELDRRMTVDGTDRVRELVFLLHTTATGSGCCCTRACTCPIHCSWLINLFMIGSSMNSC
jgi:lauroyl/myristoyl acyltransferase